ncbi:hypothetical protein BJV74DRAFT_488152 [Russula compacta]|nr:hypothetical protein BJV74DRAFT_488152 [Russula compacta]
MFAPKQLFTLALLSGLVTLTSAQARVGCSRLDSVLPGDTCNTVSARNSVSTFQLANANQGAIDPLCDNLQVGESLCLGLLGRDCKTVAVVKPGDTCFGIANAAGIPVTTLLANNPNVEPGCTNLTPGEVLCTASQIFDYTA